MIISEKDTTIQKVLTENGRESTSAIARRLGLSRATVQTRIDRMLETEVIRRFSVEMGASFQKQTVSAYVMIEIDEDALSGCIAEIAAIAGVESVASTCGACGYIAELVAPSTEKLDEIIDEIRALRGVRNTETHVVLKKVRTTF